MGTGMRIAMRSATASGLGFLLTCALWVPSAHATATEVPEMTPPLPVSAPMKPNPRPYGSTYPVAPARSTGGAYTPYSAQPPSSSAFPATWSPYAIPAAGATRVSPAISGLTHIQAARVENGRLVITSQSRGPLVIKNRFVLDNPRRLVVDLANTYLDTTASNPSLSNQLGDVAISNIRLGQFTEDTVRLVVETSEPERLQVSLHSNSLVVLAAPQPVVKRRGFFSSLFGRSERPEPVASSSSSSSRSQPQRPAPVLPSMSPNPRLVNESPMFPHLENIQKLQRLQNARMQTHPLTAPSMTPVMTPASMPSSPQRARIMEIARSQVGLSKDVNPDYVIQTFSRGRDVAWCADFVSTILDWAGGSPWGHVSRVQDIYEWGVSNRRLTLSPEAATLVIFSYSNGSFDHVAFVESVNPDNTITTIGGNEGYAAAAYKTTGSVSRSVYSIEDKRILGFVDPLPLSRLSEADPSRHTAAK